MPVLDGLRPVRHRGGSGVRDRHRPSADDEHHDASAEAWDEARVVEAGVPVTVEERMDVSRKADTAVTRADTSKLRAATGWGPTYPLDRTLGDMLADWRGR